MLIITQDSQKNLSKEIELCAKQGQSWRCVKIALSLIDKKPENWFSVLSERIRACFGDDGGRIYLFENDNVYVLTRHASSKSSQALSTYISILFGIHEELIVKLYELPMDKNIIIKDLEDNIPAQSAAQKATPFKVSVMPTLVDIAFIESTQYSRLVASLQTRRKKRDTPSILIVEDDIFSQRLVKKVLGDGYQIVTAGDAKSALDAYVMYAPDMLLLDIGLPDACGIGLINHLFAIDPQAYVVMLSGNTQKENIIKALQAGAKGFIGKPFTQEKIFQYVDKSPFIREKSFRG